MISQESTYDEAIRYLVKAEVAIQEGKEVEAGLYVQMADVLTRLSGQRPRGPRRGPDFAPPMPGPPVAPIPIEDATADVTEDVPGKGPRTATEAVTQPRPATRLEFMALSRRHGPHVFTPPEQEPVEEESGEEG